MAFANTTLSTPRTRLCVFMLSVAHSSCIILKLSVAMMLRFIRHVSDFV